MAGRVIAGAEPVAPLKLELRAGRPIVNNVYINGHGPYRFLVDTGATTNVMDRTLARSIGLRSTFQTRMTSSTSTVPASGADGVELRVGPITVERQPLLLTNADALHAIGRDINGVLGQTFLSRFDYLLDLRHQILALGVESGGRKGTRLPFETLDGRPVITTSLGSLIVDSGAHMLIRFRMTGSIADTTVITATGSVMVGTVFSALVIDGHPYWAGNALALPESPETGADGILPVATFKSVYVSNSARYLILE